ncbi:MAG: VWA domain-containing protein, partial [Planctomycetes bacterium]|nr:VWA domain-containing protein [Planctomycetota bacterium]
MIRFIHANLFLGAAAATLIPVLIHLISRYRYRRERWAAMGFLLAAMKRSTRRIRLETWLLLLLRILVILMIGMAVARPYVQVGSIIPGGAARVHRVLLIDNSGSMQAEAKGASRVTRQERAVEVALRLLNAFPEQDTVSLITLAHPAEAVIAYEAFDRHQVIERLQRLKATARVTDLVGGLQRCEELLDASSAAPGNRA